MSTIHSLIATVIVTVVLGGMGPPVNKEEVLTKLYGSPCVCKGGIIDLEPSLGGHKQITSQGEKTGSWISIYYRRTHRLPRQNSIPHSRYLCRRIFIRSRLEAPFLEMCKKAQNYTYN